MSRYWIGVASADHVAFGVAGGFMQLNHGKAAPLRRVSAGDWIIYYSPQQALGCKSVLQAFTALGQVLEGAPYPIEQDGQKKKRKNVRFVPVCTCNIRPLIPVLAFIRDKQHWGYAFRFGLVEIGEQDFLYIKARLVVA